MIQSLLIPFHCCHSTMVQATILLNLNYGSSFLAGLPVSIHATFQGYSPKTTVIILIYPSIKLLFCSQFSIVFHVTQSKKTVFIYNHCKELIASLPLRFNFLSLKLANSISYHRSIILFSLTFFVSKTFLKFNPSSPSSRHSNITFTVRPLLTKLCRIASLCKDSHLPCFIFLLST